MNILIAVDSFKGSLSANQAAEAISRESGDLRVAALLSDNLPRDAQERLKSLIMAYVTSVIDDEWPAMAERQDSPVAEQRLRQLAFGVMRLPTSEPEGLLLAAILRRADPRDVLIGAGSLDELAQGALVGTSSLRRQAQLAERRPDLRFTSIRGNVETRLRKVAMGEVAATVMAMAGLSRLLLLRRARAVALDPLSVCTPAPAQGAVAVDCRAADARTRFLLSCLNHRSTAVAVGIERQVLAGLSGGCSLPLGCLAQPHASGWQVIARLGQDGTLRTAIAHGAASPLPGRILALLRR